MSTELVARLEPAAPRAFAETPVRFAYLFGSRAGGRSRPDSDVDVAVCLDGEPGDALTLSLRLAGRLAKESGEPDRTSTSSSSTALRCPSSGGSCRAGSSSTAVTSPRGCVSRAGSCASSSTSRSAQSRSTGCSSPRSLLAGADGRPRPAASRVGAGRQRPQALHEMAKTPPGDLIDDVDRLDAVEYRFVTALEGLIDAAHHVIASERLRAPRTYADAFAVLGESGLLDETLAATAQEIARFRNLLVHGYAEVDDERVATLLMTRLDDLDELCQALGRAGAGAG